MSVIAATGASPFWFVTRATGTVSLILLTVTVGVGVANVRRTRIGQTPRFVVEAVHRGAALLAVSFVVVHVLTTLLDGFAPIGLLDAVIPFRSAYRPVWLGLGAVAFDLLIAVVVTSVLRRRFGYRAWRATHWLAYASWPVALVHGLATGTDTKTHWLLVLTAGCVALVLASLVLRVSHGWPDHLATRMSALVATALLPLGLLVWLPGGPLASGWAIQAGTPAALLASAHAASASSGSSGASPPTSGAAAVGASPGAGATARPFTAAASGRVREVRLEGGLTLVDMSLTVPVQALILLHIRIRGLSTAGGGVQMTTSRVTLGPASNPDQYRGKVTGLNGGSVRALVSDSDRASIGLLAALRIDRGSGSVSGTVSALPGARG